MATTTNVASLYEDIVADLIPYYDNFVLLPNPQLIINSYNISGGLGNQMNIPKTNAWTTGATVNPHAKVIDTGSTDQATPVNDFNPVSVTLSTTKKASGTLVAMEDFEDAGFNSVRDAVVTRLSRAIAQSTDIEGFRVIASDGTAALTNLANVTVAMDGLSATANVGNCELSFVMSPEAMGYAVKRAPEVKMFENINRDHVEYVSTLRNGFKQIHSTYIRAIATKEGIGQANAASLDYFATSVANLRSVNAPTDGFGFYAAVLTSGAELALSNELSGIGGIQNGAIGSVAQDMANDALLKGLIGQAIGCTFVRSNNTPTGLASI